MEYGKKWKNIINLKKQKIQLIEKNGKWKTLQSLLKYNNRLFI